ncbi:MAG: ParA family protein [Pyrinomonadaceae bacterium]
MIITVASFKGGVGKTTTAVHLAAYMQKRAPTLLLDGDQNRSALAWTERGRLPFKIADERQAARYARDYEHTIIDTEAHPSTGDLRTLVGGCDLLVIPTTPDGLSLHALMQTVSALDALGADRYRVLLTIVPPRPNRDGDEAREMLKARKLPMFKGEIRRRIAFQKAVIAGVPVYDVDDPRAAEAWADYERIGKEIVR